MSARLFALIVCSLLFCSSGFGQSKRIDTKHLTDKSFLVVRIDLGRMMGHLDKKKDDLRQLSDMFGEETKFALLDIEVLTLQFGDTDEDEGEPSFAMTVELKKAIDRDAFLGAFGGPSASYTDDTINGKTYLKHKRASGPHIYFESDKKFTAATAGAIEAVLKAGGGMGQMASQLKSAPAGSEVVAVFQRNEKFRESTSDLFRDLKSVPLPFDVEKMISKAESGRAYLNLASGNPLSIEMEFDSVETAESIQKTIQSLVKLGEAAIAPARAGAKQELKNLEEAGGRFKKMQQVAMQSALAGLNTAEKMLNGLTVELESKSIRLNVKHMGGLTEIADLAVSGFQLAFLGLQGGVVDKARPIPPPEAREAIKAIKK